MRNKCDRHPSINIAETFIHIKKTLRAANGQN